SGTHRCRAMEWPMARRLPPASSGAASRRHGALSPLASHTPGYSYRARSLPPPAPFHRFEEGVTAVEIDPRAQPPAIRPPPQPIAAAGIFFLQVTPKRVLDNLAQGNLLLRRPLLGLDKQRIADLDGRSHA